MKRGNKQIVMYLLLHRASIVDTSLPDLEQQLEMIGLGELYFYLKRVGYKLI